jgi:hypothetical protein
MVIQREVTDSAAPLAALHLHLLLSIRLMGTDSGCGDLYTSPQFSGGTIEVPVYSTYFSPQGLKTNTEQTASWFR